MTPPRVALDEDVVIKLRELAQEVMLSRWPSVRLYRLGAWLDRWLDTQVERPRETEGA